MQGGRDFSFLRKNAVHELMGPLIRYVNAVLSCMTEKKAINCMEKVLSEGFLGSGGDGGRAVQVHVLLPCLHVKGVTSAVTQGELQLQTELPPDFERTVG